MVKRFGYFWLAFVLLSAVSTGGFVFAYTTGVYGSGGYGVCTYGNACSISLTSNGSVTLNVTPTPSGSCTIQSDTASVLTDDTNGYTLSLADSSTNTALVNGTSTIAASSGSFTTPVALSPNSWGYRVDGLGNFGSGPTTAQINVAPTGGLFSTVEPSNATADVITSSTTPADPAVATTVWYGVCANTSINSGSYTTQITYTAIAN